MGIWPSDTSPLLDADNEEIVSRRGKIELPATVFRHKFSAPSVVNSQRSTCDPNKRPLPSLHERMQTEYVPGRLVEVKKAIDQLSSYKAPGLDGIPTDIFKNLSSCLPYLTVLANEIYRTGFIPKPLCALFHFRRRAKTRRNRKINGLFHYCVPS